MRSRIMYIGDKSGSLTGPCRIGLVRFSKTGATLYYGDRAFKSLTGSGFKANSPPPVMWHMGNWSDTTRMKPAPLVELIRQ